MKSVLVEPGKPAVPAEISSDELQARLGWLSSVYPFEDDVAFVHDDDGIANGRLPNRTLNGEIMPGPFYILSVDANGDLQSLPPELCDKYIRMFAVPESFPPGKWKVTTSVEETAYTAVLHIRSEWIATADDHEMEVKSL